MKISKLFKGIQTIQSKKRISLQQSSNPAIHQSAPGMILSRVYFAFKFLLIREIRVNSLIHLRVNSTKFDQIRPKKILNPSQSMKSPRLFSIQVVSLSLHEAGEICPVTPEQEQRKDRDDDGQRQAGAVEENVEEQDVHDHRAKQRKAQWHVTSDQKQQAANDLQQADNVNIVALHERFTEVSGQRRGRRRHWDEMQKNVRAEDHKHESKQTAGNDGGDFHSRIVTRPIENSNLEIAGGKLTAVAIIIYSETVRSNRQTKRCRPED